MEAALNKFKKPKKAPKRSSVTFNGDSSGESRSGGPRKKSLLSELRDTLTAAYRTTGGGEGEDVQKQLTLLTRLSRPARTGGRQSIFQRRRASQVAPDDGGDTDASNAARGGRAAAGSAERGGGCGAADAAEARHATLLGRAGDGGEPPRLCPLRPQLRVRRRGGRRQPAAAAAGRAAADFRRRCRPFSQGASTPRPRSTPPVAAATTARAPGGATGSR